MYLICAGLSVHVTVSAEQSLALWMKILFTFQFALSKCSSISSDVNFNAQHHFTQQEICKEQE